MAKVELRRIPVFYPLFTLGESCCFAYSAGTGWCGTGACGGLLDQAPVEMVLFLLEFVT